MDSDPEVRGSGPLVENGTDPLHVQGAVLDPHPDLSLSRLIFGRQDLDQRPQGVAGGNRQVSNWNTPIAPVSNGGAQQPQGGILRSG